MANTRDERIEERLEKMSSLFEHSDKKEQKSEVIELEAAKNDILNELPAEIRFQALQNGMPLDELRALYSEVKTEYAAKKLEYQGAERFERKERRQDNVREYELDKDRQRQNEQTRTRTRSYERVRARA